LALPPSSRHSLLFRNTAPINTAHRVKKAISIIHAPLVPRDGRRYFHLSLLRHNYTATSSTYVQPEQEEDRQYKYYMAQATEKFVDGHLEEALGSYKSAAQLRPTSVEALTCVACSSNVCRCSSLTHIIFIISGGRDEWKARFKSGICDQSLGPFQTYRAIPRSGSISKVLVTFWHGTLNPNSIHFAANIPESAGYMPNRENWRRLTSS